jgi:hypothetical protein
MAFFYHVKNNSLYLVNSSAESAGLLMYNGLNVSTRFRGLDESWQLLRANCRPKIIPAV